MKTARAPYDICDHYPLCRSARQLPLPVNRPVIATRHDPIGPWRRQERGLWFSSLAYPDDFGQRFPGGGM